MNKNEVLAIIEKDKADREALFDQFEGMTV